MKFLNKLLSILQQRIDISSLVFYRIAFGGIMMWEVYRYFSKGWIERYFITPKFYFTFDGFHWVSPWEGDGMYIHFAVLGVLAFFILIGFLYRISTVLFFLGFTYIFLLDKTNYLNHFYLISLLSFLMIFLPANRAWSVDAKIMPKIRANTIHAWPVWLLRFQLGVAYFYGGIAKITPDWLQGEPMGIWLSPNQDVPVIGPLFVQSWTPYFFSYSGLLLDLLIVPALLWKRTRVWAFIFITMFHLMNAWLWKIGIFPWFMIAATTLFFEPDWFRKIINSTFRAFSFPHYTDADKNQQFSRPLMTFLGLFALVQILVPFRHLFSEGNVNWNEVGHRFSWHMKLRDKRASGDFLVKNLETQQTYEIKPRKFLTKRQNRKMLMRPDMVLQFAQYLKDIHAKEGFHHIEVNARIKASLNGRKKQWLIHPNVDLVKINGKTPHKEWIMPLTTPLR